MSTRRLWSYGFVGILLISLLCCSGKNEAIECDRYYSTEFGSSVTSKPLFPYLAKWVNWESMENKVSAAQRIQFMDTVYWYNSMYSPIAGNPDYTHVFDMNADGAVDYVYSGPGPGFDTKEMIAVFKINNTALSVLGTLKSMDFENRILKRLYFERIDETDSTNIKTQTSYEIDYKDGKPILRKFFQSEMPGSAELPVSLYEKYQLKTFCSDSIIFNSKPEAHAAASKYVTTREAVVLGEKIGPDNKKWLFIAFVPATKTLQSNDNIYQVGWTPEIVR